MTKRQLPASNGPEFRAGAYSGLLAAIMVLALSAMALIALQPPA